MRWLVAVLIWPLTVFWKFKPTRWVMQKIFDALEPALMGGIADALAREDVQALLRPMIAENVARMITAEATPPA